MKVRWLSVIVFLALLVDVVPGGVVLASSGYGINFYGTVDSLPGTPGWIVDWVVSGRTVRVTASTWIKQKYGPLAVGAYVEVKGSQQVDRSVIATQIEINR